MATPKDTHKFVDPAEINFKKPKMRTATDVISRLQWDESLPKELFVVGYLDRFKGLMEKSFTSLDWSDPAIVDNYTLALPKHRIQYFKYKNSKVWDKTTRIDIVFGSTGQNIDIYEFMKQVDEEESNFFDECFFDSKDDNDVAQALMANKTYDTSDRPNYFIAARITNEDVRTKLSQIADSIKEKDPDLEECCIKTCEYHITLSILKLDSVQQIMDVTEVLKRLQSLELKEPEIDIDKLGVFKYRVLHACVKPNKDFDMLRRHLVAGLREKNINIADRFQYVPHVTIVKLSRPSQRAKHSPYLDPSLYLAFQDNSFGVQPISKIHLCEMKDSRRDDGFYLCAAEADLS